MPSRTNAQSATETLPLDGTATSVGVGGNEVAPQQCAGVSVTANCTTGGGPIVTGEEESVTFAVAVTPPYEAVIVSTVATPRPR